MIGLPQAASVAKIIAERNEVAKLFGPWTAHDIALAPGVSTMDSGLHQQWRVDWFDELIRRHLGKRYSQIRLLDLACLEGLFTIEFARKGSTTVGIEIREQHLEKARFASRVLGLTNCSFVKGDVRSIPATLGMFDVTICAGILYHLDFPDCVTFLREIAARTRGLVLLDSHLAYPPSIKSALPLSEMRSYQFEGQQYRGREYSEHAPDATDVERVASGWASIDNPASVWLSEPDVINIFRTCGFDLAERAFPNPSYQANNPDRPTLALRRG